MLPKMFLNAGCHFARVVGEFQSGFTSRSESFIVLWLPVHCPIFDVPKEIETRENESANFLR